MSERALLDAEFAAARRSQGFCTEYGITSDPREPGPVTFECECGRFSGSYVDAGAANRVLDDHLDEQERAWAAFSDRWWADHGRPVRVRSYLDAPEQNVELYLESGSVDE